LFLVIAMNAAAMYS